MVHVDQRKFLLLIYLASALYLLPMFPHGGSANELTRWATTASLVEHRSFEISWTEGLIGANVDTAKVGDKIYSNKAPGPALLAVPVYALTRVFLGPPDASNIRISWYVMRVALSTMPLFLLGVWLYRREVAGLALATLLFATPLFIYSLLFFSHVLVAVLVYAAFRLLFDEHEFSPHRYLGAGLIAGLAVISEFPALFAVAVFGVGLLFSDRQDRGKRVVFFMLGGLPFVAILLAYNHALFGSVFSMSYAHESSAEWAEVASHGILGINIPTVSNAYLLLVSPARGLFFFAPILVLSVVGFFASEERKTLRGRIKLVAVGMSILLLCGHGAAHGGWAAGPRYLVFILPLLLDSLLEGKTGAIYEVWRGGLFTVSLLLCAIPILTFSFAPPEFMFPHNGFWTPFLTGENWYTPNLANLLGLNSIWTLLPVVLGLVGVLFLVAKNTELTRKFALGIGAGLLLVGVYLFLPGLDPDEARLHRATIAERFFKPGNRLEPFRTRAKQAVDWKALQRINESEWNIADTRAFPPNDFPYLANRDFNESPTALARSVEAYQTSGQIARAEAALQQGKRELPFARCDFSAELAVIFDTTGRKGLALRELEGVQDLVHPGSRPDCLLSQFRLGSLYVEFGRTQDAEQAFNEFLGNSIYSTDPDVVGYRQSLLSPRQKP